MAQEIYNEGRVVGLSAYEMFLKQLLAKDPIAAENPPTEVEWLASMVGMGSSMVLKIRREDIDVSNTHVYDFPLPSGSNLTAAGTVIASVFDGECSWSNEFPFWARKVTSYGGLIKNDGVGGDTTPNSTEIKYKASDLTSSDRQKLYAEFAKITDGIFIQQGNWVETETGFPYKDLLNPDFDTQQGFIRLYFEDNLHRDVYVIFTGLLNKQVIQGISGEDGSTDPLHNDWVSGGMLGPEIFPWSSKIIFSIPNGTYFSDGLYSRDLPKNGTTIPNSIGQYEFNTDSTSTTGIVSSHPVIDFKSIDLDKYYDVSNFSDDPRLVETINTVALGTKNDDSVIAAWYPGMTASRLNTISSMAIPDSDKEKFFFPPALYGIKVTTEGDANLIPLDTAAPGTIKVFEDPTVAYNYVVQNPNNYAIYHTYDNVKHIDINFFISKDSGPDINNWQSMSADLEYSTTDGIDYTKITVGDKSYETVSLSDSLGQRLPINGTTVGYGINELTSGFNWSHLLKALHNNQTVDPVGDKLRSFNIGLPNVVTVNNDYVSIGASAMNNPSSGATIKRVVANNNDEIVFNKPPKSGTEYIVFSNGLRLYISGSAPSTTNVPVGSIGIGW